MAKKTTPTVDVVNVLYDAVENQLSDSTEDYDAMMTKIQPLLAWEVFNDLETAVNLRVCHAMQEAFRCGWTMRGQV